MGIRFSGKKYYTGYPILKWPPVPKSPDQRDPSKPTSTNGENEIKEMGTEPHLEIEKKGPRN